MLGPDGMFHAELMSPSDRNMLMPVGGGTRNRSADLSRRQAGTSGAPVQPTASTIAVPCAYRPSRLPTVQPPLSTSALEKRPAASGELTSRHVLRPPADSPNSMIRSGSPPNEAMLSFTQRSAAI